MKTHMQTRQKLDLCYSEQRDTKNCQKPLEKGESPGMESLEPPEGMNFANTQILDLWHPGVKKKKVLWVETIWTGYIAKPL